MAFHEVRFPEEISYGVTSRVMRKTHVVDLSNGFRQTNQVWQQSLHEYDASVGVRRMQHISAIKDFWEARSGRAHGFRWKDWVDYKSCAADAVVTDQDQIIATGNGSTTAFQLVKRYTSGGVEYVRLIKKPVAGTVVVSVNAVSVPSGWSVDPATGIITFVSAPTNGHIIRAGYEFDVPAAFAEDDLRLTVEGFQAGAVPAVVVREIRV